MVHDYFDKYIFLCEMYDDQTNNIKEVVLNFFPYDNAVQVIDPKRGKNLLKRTQLPTLTIEMLQIGNVVNVFGKLISITVCAPATRKTLFHNVQSTFALIKPIPPDQHGKIITYIMKKGFKIVRMKNGTLSKEVAMKMYADLGGNSIMPIVLEYVTSGEVIGLELVAPNAVTYWRECLGATNPKEAAPGTLRQLFGEDVIRNVAHGCSTVENAAEMLELYFGEDTDGNPIIPFKATIDNCTCCIIKPHTVIDGNIGAILETITKSGKFYISAMAMFTVKLVNAQEFYEIYKGVLQEYESMCVHLAEGRCICLEVKCIDPSLNVVCEFRKLCGPRDPGLCRQLYPDYIRAIYGKDIIHNAVHCTDLPEDGEMEVEYFFRLLVNH